MVAIFQDYNVFNKYLEILKVIQCMFAILGHNATAEQIFSSIEAQWTDERKRLVVETIKYITVVSPQ